MSMITIPVRISQIFSQFHNHSTHKWHVCLFWFTKLASSWYSANEICHYHNIMYHHDIQNSANPGRTTYPTWPSWYSHNKKSFTLILFINSILLSSIIQLIQGGPSTQLELPNNVFLLIHLNAGFFPRLPHLFVRFSSQWKKNIIFFIYIFSSYSAHLAPLPTSWARQMPWNWRFPRTGAQKQR